MSPSPKIEWTESYGSYWFFHMVIEDENPRNFKTIKGEINKWRDDYFSWNIVFQGPLSLSVHLSTEGNAQSLEAAQGVVPEAFRKMLQEQIAKRKLEIELFSEALDKCS